MAIQIFFKKMSTTENKMKQVPLPLVKVCGDYET